MSLYTREFAGVAREVQKGVGGVVSLWPKLNGVNIVVSSATSSRGTVDAVDLPSMSPAYSRLDVTLGPGDATDYGESNELYCDWSNSDGSGRELVTYDVVRSPIGLLVSANQMRERRPSLQKVLTRLGALLVEPDDTAMPPEEVAAIYSATARVELQDKLRNSVRDLALPGGSSPVAVGTSLSLATMRCALVTDRARLLRAETALAVCHCYEAIAKDPLAGKDEDSAQAIYWRREYERAWKELGPLAVDLDQDGNSDQQLQSPAIGLIVTHRG